MRLCTLRKNLVFPSLVCLLTYATAAAKHCFLICQLGHRVCQGQQQRKHYGKQEQAVYLVITVVSTSSVTLTNNSSLTLSITSMLQIEHKVFIIIDIYSLCMLTPISSYFTHCNSLGLPHFNIRNHYTTIRITLTLTLRLSAFVMSVVTNLDITLAGWSLHN